MKSDALICKSCGSNDPDTSFEAVIAGENGPLCEDDFHAQLEMKSDAQHTAGEWTLDPEWPDEIVVGRRTIAEVMGGRFVSDCRDPQYEIPAEVQANARLISTAPSGLALAQHILALETDPYLQGHPEWEAFLNESQELVKKATEL